MLDSLRKNKVLRMAKRLVYSWIYKVRRQGVFSKYIVLSNGIKIRSDYATADMPGSTDFFEIGIVKKLLKLGDSCIDVGANVGAYALNMSTAVGDGGRVYAFEASPQTFKVLEENVATSGLKNISAFPKAVGDKLGTIDLFVTFQSGLASVHDTGRGTVVSKVEVPLTTLDKFISEENIQKVDLLKIDVEGFETAVLKGAENLLKNYNVKVFTELDEHNSMSHNFNRAETVKWMATLGYKAWGVDRGLRRVVPLDMHNMERVMNVIFSKDDINILI